MSDSTDRGREVYDAVLSARARYAAGFDKDDLARPSAGRFAILPGRDARLDPPKHAGLLEGDAHVIRKAGDRASDVRRIGAHPLGPVSIPIIGFIYDVATGRLEEVEAASEAGRRCVWRTIVFGAPSA